MDTTIDKKIDVHLKDEKQNVLSVIWLKSLDTAD